MNRTKGNVSPRSPAVPRSISSGCVTPINSPRKKPDFPGSLTDLHRYRKTVHGHDGDSRIVMVRKTDERTYASIETGKKPQLETVTRETVETFRGQRTELKVTTERVEKNEIVPSDLLQTFGGFKKSLNGKSCKKRSLMPEFDKQVLRQHNALREKHGAPPLALNSKLSRFSQRWAHHLVDIGKMEHNSTQGYGENIFSLWSSDPDLVLDGEVPVNAWYAEIKDYNFNDAKFSKETGHFTQVVWKNSVDLGVGIAKKNGTIYVVTCYSPPGNVVGAFDKNVLPLVKKSSRRNTREANNNDEGEKGSAKLNIGEKIAKKFSPLSLISNSSRSSLLDVTDGQFEQEFLSSHNEYRTRHGVPPLKLKREICKYAEEWAKLLASKNALEHRKNCSYGENIYSIYSSDPNFKITGRTPVDAWYDEMKHHPFGKEPNSLRSGHFTQLVWKESEFLGVGVAKSRQGSIYVVANYSPAGNFVGSFAENVPPPAESSYTGNKSGSESGSGSTSIKEDLKKSKKFDKFQLDALKVHNEYRKKHGVPDLVLSKKLCDFALEWAEHCLKHDLGLRGKNPYGENLLTVTSSDSRKIPDAREVVSAWYNEITAHDFAKESINYDTLHFSQIVWKSTTELGIAVAQNERGRAVVVANYDPRGNVYGQFKNNVFKTKV